MLSSQNIKIVSESSNILLENEKTINKINSIKTLMAKNLSNMEYKNNLLEYSKYNNNTNNDKISEQNKNNNLENSINLNNYTKDNSNNNLSSNFFRIQRISTLLNKKKLKSTMMNKQNKHLKILETLLNINDKKTFYGKYFLTIKVCDFILAFLSIISIILMCLDSNIYLRESQKYIEDLFSENLKNYNNKYYYYKYIKNRKLSKNENILRILNMLISIIMLFIIYIKYKCKIKILILDKKFTNYDNIFKTNLFLPYIIDCLFDIIFYPPYINKTIVGTRGTTIYVYSMNSLFLTFGLLKIHNIFNVIVYISKYDYHISKTICKSNKIQPGIRFVIKSEINKRPILLFGSIFLIFCFLICFLIRNFENLAADSVVGLDGVKGINDLNTFMNNLWMVLTTITKIGFGDCYPRTDIGRLLTFLIFLFGMFCLGFTIASLSGNIEFEPVEKIAYNKLKKIFDPENIEHKAANVIKTILLLQKHRKTKNNILLNKINILKEKFILFSKIKSEAKLFKNNVAVARTYMIGMKDLIKSLEQKLYDHLYGFTSQLNKIKNIESDLDEIKEDQENIQNKLNKINYYQEQIIIYLTEINNKSYLKKIASNNKSINFNDLQQINKNKSNLSDENGKKIFNLEKLDNIRPKKSFNYNKNTAINLVINKKYNLEIKKSEKNFKYTILSGKSNRVNGKKNKDKSNLTIKLLSATNLIKIKRSKSQKNKIKRIFKFSKIENKSIVNDLKFRRLITKKEKISNFKLFSNDLKRSNKKYY